MSMLDNDQRQSRATGEDDDDSEGVSEVLQSWSVTPTDDAERRLASMVDPAEVNGNEPQFAYGVESCDFCGCSLNKRGMFVDGCLRDKVMWGNMCARCFTDKGAGVAWGKGQLFARQTDENWLMVAGFQRN